MSRWTTTWPAVLASYVLVFAVLALPLVPHLATSVAELPNPEDAQILPWVLAWVAHALATAPSTVFDANVSYPAPAQLTGTDHLFAAQILFGPLYAATGSVILASNLTILATYPLAALAMNRLLRALGSSAGTAWVCGLALALGALRTPFNPHVFIYPNLFLPWICLCLHRLRSRPTAARALVLATAFGIGIFTSGYGAVLVGLTGGVWALLELVRRVPARGRFLALGLTAIVPPSLVMLAVMQPYLALAGRLRRSGLKPAPFLPDPESVFAVVKSLALVAGGWWKLPLGAYLLTLLYYVLAVVTGLAALRWAPRFARFVVAAGGALCLLGVTATRGYPAWILPWVDGTPLSFFRFTARYYVIADFGAVLLLAAGLEGLRARLGENAGRAIAIAVLVVVLSWRGMALGSARMREVHALTRNAAVYDAVGELWAAGGRGALLELPLHGTWPGADEQKVRTLEPDAILASTRHWWPSLSAHLSYHADHRRWLMQNAPAIADPRALEDLIDLTHVRWVLLRSAAYWENAEVYRRTTTALLESPAVGRADWIGDWLLVRLDRLPKHEAWFRAVAAGDAPGRTIFGTPLVPLADGAARGTLRIHGGDLDPSVERRHRIVLPIEVSNTGTATWPAIAPPPQTLGLNFGLITPAPLGHVVALVCRWRRIAPDGAVDRRVEAEQRQPVRRDVDPGETIVQDLSVRLPDTAGLYELEVGLEQVQGARFAEEDGATLRLRVRAAGSR